jgi:hypothetical protein
MSITSPSESLKVNYLPMELLNAGAVVNNAGLQWADLGRRGYMLVELSHKSQLIQYLGVSVDQEEVYTAACLAAFEVRAGDNNVVRQLPHCRPRPRHGE